MVTKRSCPFSCLPEMCLAFVMAYTHRPLHARDVNSPSPSGQELDMYRYQLWCTIQQNLWKFVEGSSSLQQSFPVELGAQQHWCYTTDSSLCDKERQYNRLQSCGSLSNSMQSVINTDNTLQVYVHYANQLVKRLLHDNVRLMKVQIQLLMGFYRNILVSRAELWHRLIASEISFE